MMLSIIIPIFNERQTLPRLICAAAAALPRVEKELILVDDGSHDGTADWIRDNLPVEIHAAAVALDDAGNLRFTPGAGLHLRAHFHGNNRGKGAALRTGLALAQGDVIVIQDADLEYDPEDWSDMWRLITEMKVADVVFGTRFSGRPHRSLYFHHYLANRLISVIFNLLFNQTLSDIECCYKMFTRAVRDSLRLSCNDFGCEIEISAQMAKAKRWRIYEVGISYYGRTYADGKKITWRDGLMALWYLVRFRLAG